MPRINVVERSVKEHTCQRCREVIPKGEGYRWIKPRYGLKRVHCMKPKCAFRPTELSSSKAAVLEEAIDEARTDIELATDYDSIKDALQIAADAARDIAQEYQDASDAWAGGNGNKEFQEKADACESFADDVENWQYVDVTDEMEIRQGAAENGRHGDEEWESALSLMRDEASAVLDDFPL